MTTMSGTEVAFDEFLLNRRLVSRDDLDKLSDLRKEGSSLYSALTRMSVLPPQELAKSLADFYGISFLAGHEFPKSSQVIGSFSFPFLRDKKVFPISETRDGIIIAVADPGDTDTIDALRFSTDCPIILRVATADDIDIAIERTARSAATSGDWTGTLGAGSNTEETSDAVEHLRDVALGTPVVRFVNQLIADALHSRATDIHIEPFEGRIAIRMRIDGMLRDVPTVPVNMAKAIVSRIKILSGLNIAERRLPQDGRARLRIDTHLLDLRVATMPTIRGEAVAIRLLDNVRRALDLSKLGFSDANQSVIRKHLSAPYGLFLVSGPTGSGKTTTLATALSMLNETHRKILTIEDPIEYEIQGVNQTQAKPAIGLTFASTLRSFLRHDPDVIMVGEMRDSETADIAIHAALTGHLVLSTLHTNTAAGAVPRLLDMGVEPYLLASSLRCVIGQRLVRVLCPHCKERSTEAPASALVERTAPETVGKGPSVVWRAVGCEQCCGTGYNDRICLSEVLDVGDEIRRLIRPGTTAVDIEQTAVRLGMTTMIADGYRKCSAGDTTPEEVRRVALDI